MPSSHASTVTALATGSWSSGRRGKLDVCGCYNFAIIVMYDASGVRLAVSKQAKILNDFSR